LNAPGGGECGGIAANAENSLSDETVSEAINSCPTVIGAEAGRLGATTMAGCGALAAQQFAWMVLFDWDAGAQQLCAALCFI